MLRRDVDSQSATDLVATCDVDIVVRVGNLICTSESSGRFRSCENPKTQGVKIRRDGIDGGARAIHPCQTVNDYVKNAGGGSPSDSAAAVLITRSTDTIEWPGHAQLGGAEQLARLRQQYHLSRLASHEGVAMNVEESRILLATGLTEGVVRCAHGDVLEPDLAQHRHPAFARKATCDSSGPQIDIRLR
jgi:hypothetical protein